MFSDFGKITLAICLLLLEVKMIRVPFFTLGLFKARTIDRINGGQPKCLSFLPSYNNVCMFLVGMSRSVNKKRTLVYKYNVSERSMRLL